MQRKISVHLFLGGWLGLYEKANFFAMVLIFFLLWLLPDAQVHQNVLGVASHIKLTPAVRFIENDQPTNAEMQDQASHSGVCCHYTL
jgi:hypothetical protein